MKWLARVAIALLIVLAIAFGIYLLNVAQVVKLEQPVTIQVPNTGSTWLSITTLAEADIISSRVAFAVHLILTNHWFDVQAGNYTFTGQNSFNTVMKIITQPGDYQPEVQVTLLEGWTNEQMADTFAKKELMTSAQFLTAASAPDTTGYTWLTSRPAAADLQGFLFPDTYRFFKGAEPSDILQKMLDNFDQKFTKQMRDDLAARQHSVYDAITLASIVEKEARSFEDKKIVAGIFWNRLATGKRLESDATINYITKKNTTLPTLSDLAAESTYNTYRNNGLPPTPICNPGLDAINAVIYPTETNYVFFLNTPDGAMKYSETYEQHLELKHQYYD
ncbi:MAG: endolytic transglycosylase MltG [Patescibacteria group bacterium]|jgi:UPF0755 protein